MTSYIPGTQIEIVRDIPRGGFRHALFDFDGTISLLREGWQAIMGPVMLEMICGNQTPTREVETAVTGYIDESTGLQTLVQMEHLATMVRHFGFVGEDQVKDAAGYKAVYLERLMEPVRERLERLERGALAVEDATVRGSIDFVRALHDRGMALYIFSGTDREDVQNEAERLGVARYFTEIWGALPTIEAFSKEKVLRELMAAHALEGSHVLIVGDGPVEIRNARDHGCVSIGVASDEARGHGWDESKRKRLTNAGADLLVPDFAERDALIEYLFSA